MNNGERSKMKEKNKNKKHLVTRLPWKRYEEVIYKIGIRRSVESPQPKYGKDLQHILSFLHNISFLDESMNLSDIGQAYYLAKFVQADEEKALNLIRESLKNYEPIQMICQSLWGCPDISKENVRNLLLHMQYIDPKFKDSWLGSFITLLSKVGIISYSKKFKKLKITFNPNIDLGKNPEIRIISPDTPFTNVKNIREILERCKEYIHWVDKHFSIKGLDTLDEIADGSRINEIKILSGPANVNKRFFAYWKRFKQEMGLKKIRAECRVITTKDALKLIHDRWIISKNIQYNIPPIDTIFQGQWGEFKVTNIEIPFDEWWRIGVDIDTDFEKIQHIM